MKIHKFHFIITAKLKSELNEVTELNEYSFSGKINFILSKIENTARYLVKFRINENSRVEYLQTRKDIQLYIEEDLFQKIKYYHGKFNSYSIALFVRMMIRLFLNMIKEYGFKGALKRLRKETKILKKYNCITNKKHRIVQLLNYLGLKSNYNLKFKNILMKLLL